MIITLDKGEVSMQARSGISRARLHWPCAAALSLILAAPVLAHDNERREEAAKSPWDTTGMENPCVKNPLTNGKGERLSEQMRCETGACGTLRTETRTTGHGDKTEQRTRTRGDGFGTGDFTNVRYNLALDRTTVTRTKRSDTRMTIVNRELGQPVKTTLPTGSSSGPCTAANIPGCASPFVVTTKTEIVSGSPRPPETETKRSCENRDGSPRREWED
jgi:hypothetical protein